MTDTSKPTKRLPHARSGRWGIAVLCPLLVAVAGTANAGDDARWPSFRGPNARGIAEGSNALPSTWNVESGENVRWKTPIPGLGHSSPVVWGNRVFVTTAVPDSGEASLKVGLYGNIVSANDDTAQTWKVLALDLETGKVLWQRDAHHGIPKVKRHTKATHANSTPATDGERVVAMFGSEGLYAYDFDGNLLWKKDLGVLDSGFYTVPGAQWGFSSSPVIHQGRLILQVDIQKESFLAAYDVATGGEIWRTPREEVPTWGSPTIAPRGDQLQVAVNDWKHIGGYDFATGRELWRLAGGGDIPVPTPIVYRDLILITNAHGGPRPIYAVRTSASGDITGSAEYLAWSEDKSGTYMQTPIVVGDLGYFCLDNGVLTVLDIATGERVYQQRLGSGQTGFTASPVAGDGKVYFTSEDGEVYVLGAGREFQHIATNELAETFMSTPAIAGDTMLFRTRGNLIAIQQKSP